MPLTGKRLRFAQEYAVDHNATQAAIRAGYSKRSAHTEGCRLLKNDEVRAALGLAELSAAERANVSTVRVLEELACIAFVDIGKLFDKDGRPLPIHKIPEKVRRALVSFEVDEGPAGFIVPGEGARRVLDDGAEVPVDAPLSRTTKFKLGSKEKALELLGRHLAMFVDKVQHSGTLTLEELIARAAEPPAKKDGDAP